MRFVLLEFAVRNGCTKIKKIVDVLKLYIPVAIWEFSLLVVGLIERLYLTDFIKLYFNSREGSCDISFGTFNNIYVISFS